MPATNSGAAQQLPQAPVSQGTQPVSDQGAQPSTGQGTSLPQTSTGEATHTNTSNNISASGAAAS